MDISMVLVQENLTQSIRHIRIDIPKKTNLFQTTVVGVNRAKIQNHQVVQEEPIE